MSSKKRVLLLFILTIFVSAGIISAGFFGSITGKVSKPSTAKVQVVGVSQPPVVFYVSDINDTTLSEEDFSLHSFHFLACSVGGNIVLPDTPTEVNNQVTPFSRLNGTYGPFPNSQLVSMTSCKFEGEVAGRADASCAGGQAGSSMNYSCIARLYYYYDAVNWHINASLIDVSNRLGQNTTTFFTIGNLYAWRINPSYVNWTGVTIGGSAKASDNNITVVNTGNQDIISPTNTFSVNATPLNGTGAVPADQILGSSFRSGPNDPCGGGGVPLSNNGDVGIPTFVVDHKLSTQTIASRDDITFCLSTVTNINPQTYETNSLNPWYLKTIN
jgi:hypothetical protein